MTTASVRFCCMLLHQLKCNSTNLIYNFISYRAAVLWPLKSIWKQYGLIGIFRMDSDTNKCSHLYSLICSWTAENSVIAVWLKTLINIDYFWQTKTNEITRQWLIGIFLAHSCFTTDFECAFCHKSTFMKKLDNFYS